MLSLSLSACVATKLHHRWPLSGWKKTVVFQSLLLALVKDHISSTLFFVFCYAAATALAAVPMPPSSAIAATVRHQVGGCVTVLGKTCYMCLFQWRGVWVFC